MIHPEGRVTSGIKDMVKFDQHALIEWKSTLITMMKNEYAETGKCEYFLGLEEIFLERVAFAFKKNDPWIEEFNWRFVVYIMVILKQ